MRVLVVPAQVPSPEGGAAARGTVALLRGLHGHGVDVVALAPRWTSSEAEAAPSDLPVTVVNVDVPPLGGVGGGLQRLRRPVGELAATALADAVRDLARDVDVVHLDQIETACLGPLATPSALHLHYRARLDASLGAPWRSDFRHRLEFASAERRAVRDFPYLVASADDVARQIRRDRHDADVTVMPLPVDPADYPALPPVAEPVVGIIGTATWAPTAAAIRRLLDEVWPHVLTRVPEARLRIAGRGTQSIVAGHPSIEIVGEVPSAAEFLSGLAVLLYPAPRGSGAKVKVLEALACGVPVVTTPPGAEGLDANDGVSVHRTSEGIAAICGQLLANPQERADRGRAAQAYIERRHAPLPATEPLTQLYRRMAERG